VIESTGKAISIKFPPSALEKAFCGFCHTRTIIVEGGCVSLRRMHSVKDGEIKIINSSEIGTWSKIRLRTILDGTHSTEGCVPLWRVCKPIFVHVTTILLVINNFFPLLIRFRIYISLQPTGL